MPNGGLHGEDYPKETDEEVVYRILRERDECRKQHNDDQQELNRLKEENATLKNAIKLIKNE